MKHSGVQDCLHPCLHPTHTVDLGCEHGAPLSGDAQGSCHTHQTSHACCPCYSHLLSLHLVCDLRCDDDADLAPFDDYTPCCSCGLCLGRNLSGDLCLCHVHCAWYSDLSQWISPVMHCFPWQLRDGSRSFLMMKVWRRSRSLVSLGDLDPCIFSLGTSCDVYS